MDTSAGAAVTLRERVLLELARRDKSDIQETFQALTEAAAVVLDVVRVSVWALVDGGAPLGPGIDLDTRIICKDLYLANERRHVSFLPIHGRDFPAYLRAIHERRTIVADDARSDPRTAEFSDFYLKPLGITSMMDVPIWHHGHVYGVLCFEHVGPIRRWLPDDEAFAINMADIASGCLEAAEHVAVRRRWEMLIESLSEGVAVIDARRSIIACNRAGRRMFPGETCPASWDELVAAIDLVDAADRPVPASDWPFERVLRGERVQGEIYGLVFKGTGERRYIRLTCSPALESGRVDYVAFIVVDATEEMFVERLKRELLSGVAHELKTPLAIAKGYAQQLATTRSKPEGLDGMIDAIVRACDRLDHLSETLLDLASMILGRLRLTQERVDLAVLLRTVVRRAERSAPSHRFQLEAQADVAVVVDSTRIAQALRHLLDNAVNYSAPGSTVDVVLSTDASNATMTVRDHGIGIPELAKKGVFTLFFKAHAGTRHDAGGLGVGLYLAREILRRHGGDLWCEGQEGVGSSFHMVLPLERTT
ncbi:MAG: GAF domain-containing protein [Labilithrix sp.]|nr:GAF domain-containing protein [Labilithrix sp.]MBX3223344.1 GAF domain-containing protein [Labilithrix sp.]